VSDEIRGLDYWIEGTPPDPGSGDGEAQPIRLTCAQCDFRGSFSNAAAHHEVSGHTLLFRGNPQVFRHVDPAIRAYHEKYYGTQPAKKVSAA